MNTEASDAMNLEKTQILVVDDEEDMCWALKMIIELEGYGCTAVRSAAEALQTISRLPFHVAFIDIKLSDMEGLDLVDRIHQLIPTLPCVLVSGFYYVDDSPIQERITNGAVVRFISKPFRIEEVQEAIRSVAINDENRVVGHDTESSLPVPQVVLQPPEYNPPV